MFKRLRRVRLNPTLRELVQEHHLRPSDFIYPLFIRHGEGIKNEVASMPGVYQMSLDVALQECEELLALGLSSIILFGIPETKDSIGSEALCEHGIMAQSLRAIKERFPKMFVSVDLCFCEYTDHGHCGIIDPKTQSVDNDATLEILAEQALILAQAGADMIAPSGMMDGMITTLRSALDKAGFVNLPLMSYSTKFASAYYGPFRDVAQSAPSFGDRRTYQQNPANRREAILESLRDEEEGADILMVKPALAYLDIIRDVRERTLLPLAVYNVSGEYAMLKAAQKAGIIDYERVMMETLLSFKRAGADIIITYHAKEAAKLLSI
ncbi:porphobilinogen synthase [Wolinella succinogenes]|uniref:Delta-aminolevulinic acid dehydratase n=1 Tax=Wolinella succinogenes (strain ATCC 29543 / DSM 1740 / CCUG 13145 / JCM 31913 / LMG 7466 / NCTC 11488 / FDC 602W) TaxID=273121 RepID=Q7M882_WOLSU|nr:porphobilinogen synthase [Wolinella succinogenes]CAE10836.1 DELTA-AMINOLEVULINIC ACID DEHYDRATASE PORPHOBILINOGENSYNTHASE ALADH [Wolinella succinogenes]VEG80993.1 Delta-aminolevulinic acid dehydratase [Wolinella succinogenes]HCZ18511.1 porphobilinogen synthase [Helicobacter sp.]